MLAGLEAIRLLRERGIEPRRPIWLVSFMDEEGARFGASLFGSRAFVGEPMQRYSDCRDAAGVTPRDVLVDTGRSFEGIGAARAIDDVGAYLELHIEQGPTLEEAGLDIGVVTGIAGSQRFFARFVGKANHAGTTPMAGRRDALAGAARAALALREEARSRDDLTATVGTIRVEPGSVNVIPGICEFSIDMRSPADEGFASIEPFVRSTLEQVAASEGLELELEQRARNEPEQLPRGLQDVLEQAAELEGARSKRMPSGAGHDAMVLAPHVPTGMVFVPSRGGISHSPSEFTEPGHCDLGARVLARGLELLAGPADATS